MSSLTMERGPPGLSWLIWGELAALLTLAMLRGWSLLFRILLFTADTFGWGELGRASCGVTTLGNRGTCACVCVRACVCVCMCVCV